MGRLAFFSFVGLILGFVIAPLLIIIWASFFENRVLNFPPSGYTFSWFLKAWEQQDFSNGFITSIQLGLSATCISLILGIPAALAIEREEFPFKETIRQILLSPMYVPAIVAGAAVYVYFVQLEIFTNYQIAGTFKGLLIAHVLIAIPWSIRLICASLAMKSSYAEEAAASLGANPFQIFYMVTLPSIRSGIIAAALFSFIASFSDLEKSLFLVGPGKITLPISIINYLEWNLDPTIAAVATVQILIIATALLISDRFVNLGKAF